MWTRSQDKNRISYGVNVDHPMFSAFAARLNEEAAGEFRRVLGLVASTLPVEALYVDVSANAESVAPQELDSDDFEGIVEGDLAHPSQGRAVDVRDRIPNAFG